MLAGCAFGQLSSTPVTLAPVPQYQFFDFNGNPLAFGCIFTYQTNTSTPLATFTDYTGTIQNPNPIILSGSGAANVWLQSGQSYRIIVRSAGGTNCSLGTTIEMVDGIGGGGAQLTIVVPYSTAPSFADSSQNTLFQITLTGPASAQPLTATGVIPPGFVTWEITQDSAGNHAWSWPANVIGGATICQAANCTTQQEFLWNGTNAYAVGGATYSTPAFAFPSVFDFFLSPNGVVCTDANRQLTTSCSGVAGTVTYNGQSVAFGGSGNVNAGAATHSLALNEGAGVAIGALLLGADTVAVGVSSADPIAASLPNCPDADGEHLNYSTGGTFTCGSIGSVGQPQKATLSSPVGLSNNLQQTILTKSVTFPSTPGTYRAVLSYTVYITTGENVCFAEAIDATNSTAYAASGGDGNGTAGYVGLHGSEITTATYAAGAAVNFRLDVECNNLAGGLGSASVNMTQSALFVMSPAEVTNLSITPILSH